MAAGHRCPVVERQGGGGGDPTMLTPRAALGVRIGGLLDSSSPPLLSACSDRRRRDVLFSLDLYPIRRPDRRRQRPSNHQPVASIAQLQLYRRPLLFSPRALFAPGYLFPRSVSEIMGASKMQKEGFFSFREKITLYPRATLKI